MHLKDRLRRAISNSLPSSRSSRSSPSSRSSRSQTTLSNTSPSSVSPSVSGSTLNISQDISNNTPSTAATTTAAAMPPSGVDLPPLATRPTIISFPANLPTPPPSHQPRSRQRQATSINSRPKSMLTRRTTTPTSTSTSISTTNTNASNKTHHFSLRRLRPSTKHTSTSSSTPSIPISSLSLSFIFHTRTRSRSRSRSSRRQNPNCGSRPRLKYTATPDPAHIAALEAWAFEFGSSRNQNRSRSRSQSQSQDPQRRVGESPSSGGVEGGMGVDMDDGEDTMYDHDLETATESDDVSPLSSRRNSFSPAASAGHSPESERETGTERESDIYFARRPVCLPAPRQSRKMAPTPSCTALCGHSRKSGMTALDFYGLGDQLDGCCRPGAGSGRWEEKDLCAVVDLDILDLDLDGNEDRDRDHDLVEMKRILWEGPPPSLVDECGYGNSCGRGRK